MANAKIKTSELTIKDSPSTSATLVGVDNGETVQIPISAIGGGSSSSSGGGSIVYANELPSTMQPETLYVVTQPEIVGAGIYGYGQDLSVMGYIVEVVDVLPANPKVCTDINKSFIYVYFLTSDNSGHAYIDDDLAGMTGFTSGWYSLGDVCMAFGVPYGGIVESMEEMTNEEALYVMPRKADIKSLYHYKDNTVVKLSSFPATSDIVTTPNPCVYKVREMDEFHIVSVDTDENGMAAGAYIDKMEGMDVYIEVVDKLPEVGEMAMNLENGTGYFYYNRIDGSIYIYITEELSDAVELPVGWVQLMPSDFITIIHSLEDATDPDLVYGLFTKKPHLYFYDGEDWIEISSGFRMAHNPKLETITFVES